MISTHYVPAQREQGFGYTIPNLEQMMLKIMSINRLSSPLTQDWVLALFGLVLVVGYHPTDTATAGTETLRAGSHRLMLAIFGVSEFRMRSRPHTWAEIVFM